MSKQYVEVKTMRDPRYLEIVPSEMTPGYYAVYDHSEYDDELHYAGFVNVYDLADFIEW